MSSVDDNFDGQKYFEHHMKGCPSESEQFLQKKIALIEATDMILKINSKEAKSVALKVLELSRTSVFQSSDYCKGLSSLKICFTLSESSACEKLIGFEMKSLTISTRMENGTVGKHMFHLKDAFDVINSNDVNQTTRHHF